jgi:hypothetical protein
MMEWESLYKNLKVLNFGILLVLTSVSYFVMSHAFTVGIVIGGLIALASFHMLQHTIRKGFAPDRAQKTKKGLIIAKFFLRFGATGVLIYLVISRQWAHPVGLTVGLSIVVISIVILGLMSIRRMFLEETT